MVGLANITTATSHFIFRAGATLHPAPLTTTTLSSLLLQLFSLLCIALSVSVIFASIYNIFFSPLRHVPGPWYAAISEVWFCANTLALKQAHAVETLHAKYGPIVRIGPSRVSFIDTKLMRHIYGSRKFNKSAFYRVFRTNNSDHAFTMTTSAEHTPQRKAFGPHYAPTNLASLQPEINTCAIELLRVMQSFEGKSALDCVTLFSHLIVDVIQISSFGIPSFSSISRWSASNANPDRFVASIHDFPFCGLFRSMVPSWSYKWWLKVPVKRFKEIVECDEVIGKPVKKRVEELRQLLAEGKMRDMEQNCMLSRLIQHRHSNGRPFPEESVIAESMAHFTAGVDTTSTTLSYVCWTLGRRPDIVAKLQVEIDEMMPDRNLVPDITRLQQLPYLNAFIKEALRLYGGAPGFLPRIVPPTEKSSSSSSTGASNAASTTSTRPFTLFGYTIPPGTIVGTQAWSMHRQEELFPDAEEFKVERWLEGNETEEMRLNFVPFGVGARTCGGQNLAMMILRIITTVLIRNFTFKIPSQTTEKSMAVCYTFTTFPAAKKCEMIFEPREAE